MKRKSQTWSTDAIIATVVFLVIIITFFSVLTGKAQSERVKELAEEGSKIPDLLTSYDNSSIAFIKGTVVDPDKLDEFAKMDYEDLKGQFGLQGDFCIHFEDEDGNIVFIGEAKKVGIGSPRVTISGIACS